MSSLSNSDPLQGLTPAFDYGASLARMGDDAGLFLEMVRLLQEDGPRLLKESRAALERRDSQRLAHAAHTLKGLAANFSANRAVTAAASVERLARDANWEPIEPAFAALREAHSELQASLEAFTRTAGKNS
jgi:HPt (histidine-containing phosphotransfer) domain-containing protein